MMMIMMMRMMMMMRIMVVVVMVMARMMMIMMMMTLLRVRHPRHEHRWGNLTTCPGWQPRAQQQKFKAPAPYQAMDLRTPVFNELARELNSPAGTAPHTARASAGSSKTEPTCSGSLTTCLGRGSRSASPSKTAAHRGSEEIPPAWHRRSEQIGSAAWDNNPPTQGSAGEARELEQEYAPLARRPRACTSAQEHYLDPVFNELTRRAQTNTPAAKS